MGKVARSYPAPAGRWSYGVRRWEAAKTHRLNQAHWLNAAEGSINAELASDLAVLRARAIYEADNNALVDGTIFTHYVDIVGRDGPDLQVQSESEAYNDWLESHWRRWFKAPTPNPRVSGAALLRLWVQSLWKTGEFLAQKITAQNVDTPVAMRLKPIDSRRLVTPVEMSGDTNVVMGIQFSRDGQPQRYWITEVDSFGGWELAVEPTPVSPDDIVHFFLLRESDQARGVPWLASSLQSLADLRDYDAEVLEAAHQAANQGVYWYTEHSDAQFMEVDESIEQERGTQGTGPPGWKPAMLTPQQPQTQYTAYRSERQMDLGRAVAMPVMIVRLDAGRHNYSSARFDGQNYDRACAVIQYAISGTPRSTGPLSELVDDVAREAALSDRAKGRPVPPRPPDVEYEWTWPRPPHVDPSKEKTADRIGLEIGSDAPQDVLAKDGKTLDGQIAKWVRAHKKLKAAGLPPMPMILGKSAKFATHAQLEASTSDKTVGEDLDGPDDADDAAPPADQAPDGKFDPEPEPETADA